MIPENAHERGGVSVSPWLASLMMRRGESVLPRFAFYYGRLNGMSRSFRRRLRRKLAVTVTAAALLLAMGGGAVWAEPAAPEATITVVNGQVAINANGQCSLIEAIINANDQNNGRPHNDCAAGNPNGADTINLPSNGLFTLTNPHKFDDLGDIGLPWVSSTVTINGNGSTIQRNSNAPEFRVLAVGKRGNLTLNNTTIRGGYGYIDDNNYDYIGGGGILNQGQLTITGSTITDNRTGSYYYSGDGGGIYNTGTLTISGSYIVDNVAYGYLATMGGGIYSTGSLTILNSQITGNVAASARFDAGGGVYSSGTLSVQNSTFQNNAASGPYGAFGGGLAAKGSSSISGSTFIGNNVQASYCEYYNDPECDAKGGGIANDRNGVMTIANSTLSGNEAHRYGGGLVNYGDATLVNTTVTGNQGGGVQSNDRLQNVVTRLRRTIVSGNTGNEVHLYNRAGYSNAIIADKHNVFGRNGNAGISGFTLGASDIVPSGALSTILSPLANNGGPTLTHALPANSPALDRAPNTDCTAAPVNGVDQRGQPRNQNGSGGTGSNECDAGAFERAGSGGGGALPGFYASFTGSGTVGGVPFVPADILRFDSNTGWSMFFDASDVGITKNVSAFEIQNDGSILLALGAKQTVAGAGTVLSQDILRFAPTSTGNNTGGTFTMWVDGSNVGLTTTGEKIDSLGLTADGRIAVGVMGAVTVAGSNGTALKAQDEDALGFNRSNATWTNFFDGTPIPGLKGEDVNAIWVNPATGELYITIIGAFNLGGVAGDGRDIVKLTPNAGMTGGYAVSLVYDGSTQGLTTNIDALEMIP